MSETFERTHGADPGRRDPIAELVDALAARGTPPDEWIQCWSVDGDPLEAAWAASEDPWSMRDLLRMARSADIQTIEAIVGEASRGEVRGGELAEDVRRAVPLPPPLEEVEAAVAAGR